MEIDEFEGLLDYSSFAECFEKNVTCVLGKEFTVERGSTVKNNSVRYDCLIIRTPGSATAPNIYISGYYDAYCKGTPVEELSAQLAHEVRNNYSVVSFPELEDMRLECFRDKIIYTLINYEMNSQLLESTPHFRVHDLAVVFRCVVRQSSEETGSFLINERVMENWGIDKEELYHLAEENTPLLFPARIESMYELYENRLKQLLPESDRGCFSSAPQEDNMYVVYSTGKYSFGSYGAACILYEGVSKYIAEMFGSGFYVIPSSINEVLVVPDSFADRDSLERIVRQVNAEAVLPTEVLSDRVYHYPEENLSNILKIMTIQE